MDRYIKPYLSSLFASGVGFVLGYSYCLFRHRPRAITPPPPPAKTRDEILQIGRDIGERDMYPTGGGYLTASQLEERAFKAKNFRYLTEEEENDIIDAFSHIIGKTVEEAKKIVEEDGYKLHISAVGSQHEHEPRTYDASMVCVAVRNTSEETGLFGSRFSSSLCPHAEVIDILSIGSTFGRPLFQTEE